MTNILDYARIALVSTENKEQTFLEEIQQEVEKLLQDDYFSEEQKISILKNIIKNCKREVAT